MKELILNQLDGVQKTLDNFIYPLKDEYDQFGRFNAYWDVLEFINWLKDTQPNVYELHDLETCFQTIDEFGGVYINVFKPSPMPFRHDDGILCISVPIQVMIREFYDYVIKLKDDETPTLQLILDSFNKFGVDVINAVSQAGSTNTKEMAKEVLKDVLQPPKPPKKINKKEQYQMDLEALKAERMLNGIRKHSKK